MCSSNQSFKGNQSPYSSDTVLAHFRQYLFRTKTMTPELFPPHPMKSWLKMLYILDIATSKVNPSLRNFLYVKENFCMESSSCIEDWLLPGHTFPFSHRDIASNSIQAYTDSTQKTQGERYSTSREILNKSREKLKVSTKSHSDFNKMSQLFFLKGFHYSKSKNLAPKFTSLLKNS